MRFVAPEVIASATPTGLHLVGDEEDVVLVEHLLHGTEETIGRGREAADTLNGLGDHAGHITGRGHVDDIVQVLDARGGIGIVAELAERAA